MQKPIATWSQLLDCWMSENQKKSRRKKIGLYEHLGVFSETLPSSGTMRNGKLFPPQKPEHPTDESEYSSSPGVATLPTPRANDHTGGVKNRTDRGFANQLNDLPYLLPAPRTTDTGGPGIHGNGGQDLRTEVSLLPTPKASDGPNGGPNMRGSSGDLSMPSVVHQADFGKYAGAIARWAKVLGRPAPEPTEPGTKPGKRRLSALFVEWMMGQPEGRVTDPELGLSRTQQIKALGNGVVTQQAEIALGRLMERMPR